MGGLLSLRLLAGLMHDLTTAEIRLQLTHVFYLRQRSGTVGPAFTFSFRPVYLLPLFLHLELSLPDIYSLFNTEVCLSCCVLFSDTMPCNLYVLPINDFTRKKWEPVGKFSFLLQSLAVLQFLSPSLSAFHQQQLQCLIYSLKDKILEKCVHKCVCPVQVYRGLL